jgi:hypothetical protein
MSTVLDDILARIKQLPPDEVAHLRAILNGSLDESTKRDRQVPLLVPPPDISRETEWLDAHARQYAGQWVALDGDRLVACGSDAAEVYAAARDAGVKLPLVEFVEDPEGPLFAGF